MNKTVYAAVDAGNGFTNAVCSKLRGKITKTSFPSVRCKAPERSLGLGGDYEVQYEMIDWLDQRYTYGEEAVRFSAKALERHHGGERYGDKFHGMLVALALYRMRVKSKSTINLTLFMPPGLCTTEHKQHVVDSFSEGLSITVDGGYHEWEFDQINVRPEGLGAVISFMLSPTIKPLNHNIFAGEVLIVDAGTYTLDILRISDGNFDPESLATATWEADGLFRHVITPVLAAIHKFSDDDFKVITPDMVDKAIYESYYAAGKKCNVTSAGKSMDLTEAVQVASQRYTEWIVANIFDSHYRGLLGIKHVIVVGGGAYLISKHLRADTQIGPKIFDYSSLSQLKGVRPTELNAIGGQRWARFKDQ